MLVKARHTVRQQTHRLQEVVDDHRAIDVKLKVAGSTADIHRHVVAHHLAADHGQSFALGWVNLARHNR
ncbi:Uncharacterised protein [Klebsiella pneumoniae]|nr:Uncharacterised protein [Klebsiella pneumoniae]